MARKTIVIKDITEVMDAILWVAHPMSKGKVIKRHLFDVGGTYISPISLERLMRAVAHKHGFTVELKRDAWLGKSGDVVPLIFK